MDRNLLPQKKLSKRNGIVEFLRAFAMIWVASYHIWQLSWMRHTINIPGLFKIDFTQFPTNGYLGVEIFVFISGFGLFYSFAKKFFRGEVLPKLLPFIRKRALKIYPSYLLAITIALIFFPDPHKIETFVDGLWHTLTHLFFIHNLFNFSFDSILGVLWMLGVVVQFYLIFPLLCKAFLKRPVVTFVSVSLFSIIYRVIVKELWFNSIVKLYSQVPAFLDLFLFGMAAAYILCYLQNHKAKLAKLKPVFTILSVVVILFFAALVADLESKRLAVKHGIQVWQTYNRCFLGVICFFFTIFATLANRFFIAVFANPVSRFVAIVSYNFYIWHQHIARLIYFNPVLPVKMEAIRETSGTQLAYTALVFTLSLAWAAVVTFLIERPVLKYGSRIFIEGKLSGLLDRLKKS